MSYYQGDFYRGDFYRGDPGFFSFLGGLAKSAVSLIPGVGPTASRILTSGAASGVGTLAARAGSIVRAGRGVIVKHPVLTGAAAAGTIGALGVGAGRMGARRGMRMLPGMRRHRRMRVTNPKALRRAIRRAEGFSRLARRVLKFTHPRLARGRPVFKFRRKRKV